MDFAFSDEDREFRASLRTFLESHAHLDREAVPAAMASTGWLTVAWPREYGGGGANQIRQVIVKEELFRAGVQVDGVGLNMLGPGLMVHGSEELKREHLPRIARAEVRWCQGFSEPNAGSDLASLQTRAVRDGDDFVINGSKIWTSEAHRAQWMHLLVRTDPDAPKHRGISYFILDMNSPGIEIRPLIQITRLHAFNEVFFDNVRVPARNMIGELNRGWYAATTTLDFERSGVERNLFAETDLQRTIEAFRGDESYEPGRRAHLRLGLAALSIEVEVGRWFARRVAWLQSNGVIPNYEASISKTFNSDVGQRVTNFGMNCFGLRGLEWNETGFLAGMLPYRYLDSQRMTISQGTNEVQRNIIATRGLGLPRD
ncbi:MAG TPA: acyl-CoA dehydrogenase family protein [Tepidiformaceae bacterium]|jgi:alkylation response protein AidB-like acyl-CoA dehydrogenase